MATKKMKTLRKLKKPPAKKGTKKGTVKKGTVKKASKKLLKVAADAEKKNEAIARVEAGVRKKFFISSKEMKMLAERDYVQDPEQNSLAFWYKHPDRQYSELCNYTNFMKWSSAGEWPMKRAAWWQRVKEIQDTRDLQKAVTRRREIVDNVSVALGSYFEYLKPLLDKDGAVRRHAPGHMWEGLPMFALPLGSAKEMGTLVDKMFKLVLLTNGEATYRTESMIESNISISATIDPVSKTDTFTDAQIIEMSRDAVRRLQPELIEADSIDIEHTSDAEPEEEYDDDE